MVLCLKARESRSSPGLPRAVDKNLRYRPLACLSANLNLRYRASRYLSVDCAERDARGPPEPPSRFPLFHDCWFLFIAHRASRFPLVGSRHLSAPRMYKAAAGLSPRRFFCVRSVPALGRDLIDKRLGDLASE